jgi:hypothetical protein
MASLDNKGPGLDGYAPSNEPAEVGYSQPTKHRRFSLAVDQEPSSFAATPNASNADFDPIPPSKRTWHAGAYVAYWMADAWAVSNWEVGMCHNRLIMIMMSLTIFDSFIYDCCRSKLENGNWSLRGKPNFRQRGHK